MAPFHDEHYLLIAPGSTTTLVQFGLGEAYAPPPYTIPTTVYTHPTNAGQFSSKPSEGSTEISPLKEGKITNLDAFNFFIKVVYRGIIKQRPEATNIPLILMSSSRWSKLDVELVTRYVFEEVGVQAFTILPAALGAIYAYGGQPNGVVIDIGKSHTEIVPVVDYSVVKSARKVLPFGGDSINEALKKILPNWTDAQIEALKKSDVYEVLSDEDKKKSFFGLAALNKTEDNFDVAEIVTSGRTREILENREKHKDEEQVPNSQLENNSFIDSEGNEITVGKERFRGCEELIQKISSAVHQCLEKIVDTTKRQEAWEHIITIGGTSKITGFDEALNTQLIDDHMVGKSEHQSAAQAAFQTSAAQSHITFNQVPNSIRFAKMPEYFPEWKKVGYADVYFLGAQIVAKQIFTTQNENMYVSKKAYNERGPTAFWDLAF